MCVSFITVTMESTTVLIDKKERATGDFHLYLVADIILYDHQ